MTLRTAVNLPFVSSMNDMYHIIYDALVILV